MDSSLAEIVLMATLGAYSPLTVIAAWAAIKRTRLAHR